MNQSLFFNLVHMVNQSEYAFHYSLIQKESLKNDSLIFFFRLLNKASVWEDKAMHSSLFFLVGFPSFLPLSSVCNSLLSGLKGHLNHCVLTLY